jgi:hypothetical protein
MIIALSVQEVIYRSQEMVLTTRRNRLKEWQTIFLCTCWHIWKSSNVVLFDRTHITAQLLVDGILHDAVLWMTHCNKREQPQTRLSAIIGRNRSEDMMHGDVAHASIRLYHGDFD